MRRNKIKSRPTTAFQRAEKDLLRQFCKTLRCPQRDYPEGVRQLVDSSTWTSHFDALTHNRAEAKLDTLLQMLYATSQLKADLYQHVETKILDDLEAVAVDRQAAEDWF
jgi:hypothetical protein